MTAHELIAFSYIIQLTVTWIGHFACVCVLPDSTTNSLPLLLSTGWRRKHVWTSMISFFPPHPKDRLAQWNTVSNCSVLPWQKKTRLPVRWLTCSVRDTDQCDNTIATHEIRVHRGMNPFLILNALLCLWKCEVWLTGWFKGIQRQRQGRFQYTETLCYETKFSAFIYDFIKLLCNIMYSMLL